MTTKHPIHPETTDVYDTGITPDEWNALGDEGQEEIMRNMIFARIEYGWEVVRNA